MSPVPQALAQDVFLSESPAIIRYPDPLLYELLVLHEDMITQLELESRETASGTALLIEMIGSHQRTAAILRERIQNES